MYLQDSGGTAEKINNSIDRNRKVFGGFEKRVFDLVFVFAALVAVFPILVIIAFVLRYATCGPVFYVHDRIGLGGRQFGCLKFRTMYIGGERILEEHLKSNAEAREQYLSTHKLFNDPRVIPVIGSFLRRSSLDELPQLFNVLIGDMSLVGPRPVIESELTDYGSVRSAYIRARPGITGVWQVSGRNNVSFSERVAMDREYLERWNVFRDLGILFNTVFVVLRREGAC